MQSLTSEFCGILGKGRIALDGEVAYQVDSTCSNGNKRTRHANTGEIKYTELCHNGRWSKKEHIWRCRCAAFKFGPSDDEISSKKVVQPIIAFRR